MFLLLKRYDLGGIPPEILMEVYTSELVTFENWFTDYTNKVLIHKVFDKLFESKYLKDNGQGDKYWSLD